MSKIYLVAGHGGSDPGACNGSRKEANDVLKLTLAVGKKLQELGYEIKYNRTKDVDTDYYGYINEANRFNAAIVFSFHRNSFGSSDAKGYETCIYSNDGVQKKVADYLNREMSKLGFTNRGSKIRPDLAILNATTMPAVLGEFGFISNPTDNKLFDANFDKIVLICVNSILTGLGKATIAEEAPKQQQAQTTGTIYRVQVGAFKELKNAEAMLKDLQNKGFKEAFIKKD